MVYSAVSLSAVGTWVIYETGLLRKYGLEASLEYIASTPSVQALMAGEADIVHGSAAAAVSSALGGSEVVLIGAAIGHLPYEVWARPEIREPGDLRGKRLGITRLGSSVDLAARFIARKWGLTPEQDVTIVQLGSTEARVPAMVAGSVEAAVLSEPSITQARQLGYVRLGEIGRDFPYPNGALMTTRSYIKEHPEATQSFMKAYAEAISLFKRDRESGQRIMAKYFNQDPSHETVTGGYETAVQLLQDVPRATPEAVKTVLLEVSASIPSGATADPAAFLDTRFVDALDTSGFLRDLHRR